MSDTLLMRLRGQRYDGHSDMEAMQLAADEIERLRTRLELSPDHDYDGIDCRDETIRQLEARLLLNDRHSPGE